MDENADRNKANRKAWCDANREKVRVDNRERMQRKRKSDPNYRAREHSNAIAWRSKNKGTYLASIREWKRKNPEKVRAHNSVQYAKRKGAPGRYTADDVANLFCEQDGDCFYCGNALRDGYHVDHRLPISRGGTNDPSNLALACAKCNLEKWKMTDVEFVASRKRRAAAIL